MKHYLSTFMSKYNDDKTLSIHLKDLVIITNNIMLLASEFKRRYEQEYGCKNRQTRT
jgi:hypothetical protein